MKNLFALLLLSSLCFFAAPVCTASTLSEMTTDDTKEIDLSGNLPSNPGRSLVNPIDAFITGESIDVNFNASLGTITLSIADEWGNVAYQQTVTAFAGQVLSIDISSFNQGLYSIEFTNAQGQYLRGDFTI